MSNDATATIAALDALTVTLMRIACGLPGQLPGACAVIATDPDIARAQAMSLAWLASAQARDLHDRHGGMIGLVYTETPDGKPISEHDAGPYARCAGRMSAAMAKRNHERAAAVLDDFHNAHPDQMKDLLFLLAYKGHRVAHAMTTTRHAGGGDG